MTSLVITRSRHDRDVFRLAVRQHDLGGVDYMPLFPLTGRQARSIAGPHTGIHFVHEPADIPHVPPAELRVERIPDRAPLESPWRIRIGGELLTVARDGVETPIQVRDDVVEALQTMSRAVFEPGQPDWRLRTVEDLEDRAQRFRDDAETALRSAEETAREAAAARAAWEAAHGLRDTGPAAEGP
jgi:hypothetical protein